MPRASNAKGTPLVEAVDWNKRLWRTLAADCMDDRNTLTQDVRAKIVSLSLWVSKYSRKRDAREGAAGSPDRDQSHHHAGPARSADGIHTALFKKPARSSAGFFVPSSSAGHKKVAANFATPANHA